MFECYELKRMDVDGPSVNVDSSQGSTCHRKAWIRDEGMSMISICHSITREVRKQEGDKTESEVMIPKRR